MLEGKLKIIITLMKGYITLKLTEEEILHNWNELHRVINATYTNDRKSKIIALLAYFEERMALAPASAKDFYHNAFPGGLVLHTLKVMC